MSDAVLCLNAGSSSLKFALFQAGDDLVRLASGQIEGIGTAPHFTARDGDGKVAAERRWPGASPNWEKLLADLLAWIDDHMSDARLIGAGHRVVHGGDAFAGPVRLDEPTFARLDAFSPLAPLHQPHNLAAARAVAAARPRLAQVACFDTAFHRTMSTEARRFALTVELENEGVRRYGFHGLSYEFIARRLAAIDPGLAQGRVIAAHLGAGASLCALSDGRSLDTTMGFTAADGLMMATRCGALDPGVILYLIQQRGWDAQAIEDLIYRQSGLLGVSGVSGDMRELLASAAPRARAAVDLFVYRIVREIGALTAVLGGLDGLVFTAGVGEHAAPVRAAVCARLGWLGLALDVEANAAHAPVISTSASAVCVRVIPTDEERMIAIHTLQVLAPLWAPVDAGL